MKWFVAETGVLLQQKNKFQKCEPAAPPPPDKIKTRLKGGRKGTIKIRVVMAGRFPAKYNFQSGRIYKIG